MVTRDPELTERGDCIVAVSAEKGPRDLDPRMKEAIRSREAGISLVLAADGLTFEVSGRGHPGLMLSHPTDMVTRKSDYICDRTLMIGADSAACDLSERLLRRIRGEGCIIEITIVVEA